MYCYCTSTFNAFAYAECDPKANVTTINGVGLPGKMATLVDGHLMIDTIIASGERLTVEKAVRKAGTRVGIQFTNTVDGPVYSKAQ